MVKRKVDLDSASSSQDCHETNFNGRRTLPPAPEFIHCDPESAAKQVQDLLNLSESQLHVLIDELQRTDEDPILALRVNSEWITLHGEAMADEVLDFIACFEMPHDMRRDFDGARNFLFHFNQSADISNCRKATVEQFDQAFTFSPLAVVHALASGSVGISSVPLAYGAVIHKAGVRQDDVQEYDFFYY